MQASFDISSKDDSHTTNQSELNIYLRKNKMKTTESVQWTAGTGSGVSGGFYEKFREVLLTALVHTPHNCSLIDRLLGRSQLETCTF